MENLYGIGTANRFSLLFENETDPLETTIKVQDKDLKKRSKVSEKENKGKPEAPAKTKTTQPPRKVIKDTTHKVQENKREGDSKQSSRTENIKTDRPFNKYNNENREERNNKRNREDRPFNGGSFESNWDREERPKRDATVATGDFENRRGRVGGGANKGTTGRGGPRRQPEERRGKREFDRQSGSDKTHGYRGVKAIDKRDGGGAHNWGSHKDVIDEVDQAKVTDADSTWPDTEKIDPANITTESKEGETETEAVPVEEDRRELTLDEWKAQRAGRQKPTYNVRKAGEGEDPSQWKKMYELNKKKGNEEESEEEEFDTSEYPQRVGRQKHVVGIDFHFSDSSRRAGAGRGRGARAGRGARTNRDNRPAGGEKPGAVGGGGDTGGGGPGAGGRGGRDGGRDGGGNTRFRAEDQDVSSVPQRSDDRRDPRNALKVDDERDFPSLG